MELGVIGTRYFNTLQSSEVSRSRPITNVLYLTYIKFENPPYGKFTKLSHMKILTVITTFHNCNYHKSNLEQKFSTNGTRTTILNFP